MRPPRRCAPDAIGAPMSDPVISPSALARPTVVHRWSYVRECSANRRGFTDGFGGGLAGTLLGCLAVAYFAPGRLEQIWFPLFALPVVLGGFEVWRSQQVRPRNGRHLPRGAADQRLALVVDHRIPSGIPTLTPAPTSLLEDTILRDSTPRLNAARCHRSISDITSSGSVSISTTA